MTNPTRLDFYQDFTGFGFGDGEFYQLEGGAGGNGLHCFHGFGERHFLGDGFFFYKCLVLWIVVFVDAICNDTLMPRCKGHPHFELSRSKNNKNSIHICLKRRRKKKEERSHNTPQINKTKKPIT